MGFIDWIHEPDAEAIGQHLDRIRAVDPSPAPVKRLYCPYCAVSLGTTLELVEHTRLHHPLNLPLLSLGQSLATSELVVRAPIEEGSITLQNCTRIEIASGSRDFRGIQEDELYKLLSESRTGGLRLRLMNERAVDATQACSEHHIDFRIASESALSRIDLQFIETMERHPIQIGTAAIFWDSCDIPPESAGDRDYAHALANYVIGLAIKKGPSADNDSRLPFDQFKDKFMETLQILRSFQTPLAIAVSHVIRFNLNDFADWNQAESAVPGLGWAARFYHSPGEVLAEPAMPLRRALPHAAKCPVDDLTERIVDATLMVMERRFHEASLETLLPPLMSWSPLPEYDRQKIHVLMAAHLLGTGRKDDAAHHLRILRSDPTFQSWATTLLSQ